MRTFKLIDCWVQAGLLFSHLVIGTAFSIEWLFLGYLTVGAWQLSSCAVHASSKGKFIPDKTRKYYYKTLLWLLILNICFLPAWFLFGFVMLFLSPFLAIWYLVICAAENKVLAHRALVHLK